MPPSSSTSCASSGPCCLNDSNQQHQPVVHTRSDKRLSFRQQTSLPPSLSRCSTSCSSLTRPRSGRCPSALQAKYLLFDDSVVCRAFDGASTHGKAHVSLEALPVMSQVFGGLLVEGVRGVWLEEEELATAHSVSVFGTNGLGRRHSGALAGVPAAQR